MGSTRTLALLLGVGLLVSLQAAAERSAAAALRALRGELTRWATDVTIFAYPEAKGLQKVDVFARLATSREDELSARCDLVAEVVRKVFPPDYWVSLRFRTPAPWEHECDGIVTFGPGGRTPRPVLPERPDLPEIPQAE